MKDQNKTKAQLINELEKLRLLTSELKTSEAEHKQTVEELKESEEKFRSFVETSDDLVFLLNKTGHIKYISPRVKELYGYQPDELIGKHLKKTTPMSEVPKAIKVINEVMRGRSLKNFLINQKKKNEQIIPMEVNAVPLKKEGKIVGVLGIIRDITERKQSEESQIKLTDELRERFKEQNCLYGISKLASKFDISLNKMLQEIVDLIPAGWQYPIITCAEINFKGRSYRTKNYAETNWRQFADIIILQKKIGTVNVYYLEKKREIDEGPFLKEERYLINAIAEQLGNISERVQAQEALAEKALMLDNILRSAADMAIATTD
ncbi:MAG: PAS domain S-box protein, partial [Calditrichia bacterium]|nr:PAS domain S-box protein [Calditrichia bacterium]